MSTTFKLSRSGVGIELRRGVFDIEVDGTDVGSIECQGEAEIPINPGHHSLQLRAGRFASSPHDFDVTEDSVVPFRCHGAMLWPRYVASIFKPDLAIALLRE